MAAADVGPALICAVDAGAATAAGACRCYHCWLLLLQPLLPPLLRPSTVAAAAAADGAGRRRRNDRCRNNIHWRGITTIGWAGAACGATSDKTSAALPP